MAIGLAKFIKQYSHELILGLLVLVIVGPTLYYRLPFFVFSPDILYVKAKVMWVLRGSIFTDPITGLVTMHPPLYHLFLAPFVAAGMDVNFVMALTAVLVVVLIFVLTYKIISDQFDRTTAFWTCLMLPFIVEYMGPRNILLATAYYFSIPFYLAGLWLYLRSSSAAATVGAAVLWGLAFLISPVYVFLIGLTFLYEWIIKKRFRRFLVLVATFMVVIIPFLIQLYVVYSQGLGEAETFSLWRGIPNADWLGNLVVEFIAPTYHEVISFSGLAHIAILLTALILLIKTKQFYWYFAVSLLAYILTFYHFSGQYAIRIQLFFSLFLVAWLIWRLRQSRLSRITSSAMAVVLMMFALYHISDETLTNYRLDMPNKTKQIKLGQRPKQLLSMYVEKDSYVFCDLIVYQEFIMPFYPAHTLGAHRTMKYFQLPGSVADELHADYQLVENSGDYDMIDSIARKYDITIAIQYAAQKESPLFRTLAANWELAFHGPYFTIWEKPE